MKRVGWLFVAALVLLGQAAQAAEGQAYKGRFSYHWFPKHLSAQMCDKFAAEVKEATQGRLELEVFPSGQLFQINQILSAVSSGAVALGGVLDINFIPVNKNFHVVAMQRFFKSFQKQREFFATDPEGKKQWEGIQQKLGIKILTHVPVGPACYFSTRRELGSVEAFKGLKSRYLMVTEKASYDAWGVSYVSVQTPEVYSALKQGMVDVVNTVPSAIIAYNWWDFLKFIQQPYHTFHDAYVVANLKWWDGLPKDLQEIVLKQVGPKVTQEATASVMAYSDGVLKEMVEKHGGKITTLPEAEIKKFVEIDKAKVFPVIAKEMDPVFYEAAKKFVGFN